MSCKFSFFTTRPLAGLLGTRILRYHYHFGYAKYNIALFWIPLRAFEAAGLAAGWATLGQFVFPLLVLLPFAVQRVVIGRPTGAGDVLTGLFVGGSFALYFDSLLLTDVARALILFYITPAWSTLLEIVFMRRSLTKARLLALVLGFSGLLVILGGRSGVPVPQNLGDTMALISGMIFALGTLRKGLSS